MLYRTGSKIAFAFMLCMLGACSRGEPEQALRQRVAELQTTLESRDASAVQQFLAEDFAGNDGLDRRQARAMAVMVSARYKSVGVSFGPLDVTMQPPANATVAFGAFTTGGGDGPLPQRIQAWDVETAWRESGGQWVLYHAKWTPRL
jgi:hypothetical protein